jgi:hypothetical protein
MDYEEILESIVEKQEETIGMIAVQRAKRIDSIEVEDGEIKFIRDATKEDVEALMDEYKEIQGKGALGIARKAMSEILDEDTEIDLPEEIIPKDIKKEQFVSGL